MTAGPLRANLTILSREAAGRITKILPAYAALRLALDCASRHAYGCRGSFRGIVCERSLREEPTMGQGSAIRFFFVVFGVAAIALAASVLMMLAGSVLLQ